MGSRKHTSPQTERSGGQRTQLPAKRGKKKRSRKLWGLIIAFAVALLLLAAIGVISLSGKRRAWTSPEELLVIYMSYIPQQSYDKMYAMLDAEASGNISQENFVQRNSAIYEGIEAENLRVQVTGYDEETATVSYHTSMDTAAGEISFDNTALFVEGEDGYRLAWIDSMIFPDLKPSDKVRVKTTKAERGEILDRNERMLAGKGTATSAGIVPGKLTDREASVREIAGLLDMELEAIEKKLSARWVKEDSFVPVKTIPKVEETQLLVQEPKESVLQEKQRQDQLLAIPGVMLSDITVRSYPLGEAAAHLIGYVQSVTAEDLENHPGEGYTADSVIGRSGMEGLFEQELKGQNGCRIYIEDSNGTEKKELAHQPVQNGRDVRLTIDAGLQQSLYAQLGEDKSCSVAMDPVTGEVLALVSTPAYDNNDFIRGLSDAQWAALNEDEARPLYNRFRQVWCPGSSFKPVVAAAGLMSGAIDPQKDYESEGLRWQKDTSWGSYYVSTLHTYEPVTLENALIYSDNIYFAKAALAIGADQMEHSLSGLGFGQELPFEITMQKSQISNSGKIDSEIQLADSGYGQGEILVNPLHLASIYSAFLNKGNMVQPYLTYRQGEINPYWISQAFSEDTAKTVLDAMIRVVNDAHGTGYGAHREDLLLAGKTGTAEIKSSKEDISGTELGWFAVCTAKGSARRPILLISMVEDVKERGGSGYVVKKIDQVLDEWFAS